LGEHIKRARLTRGLTQDAAGAALNVEKFTILNWEKDRTEPPVTSMPAILAFLGYDPFPAPTTLAGQLKARRRALGWSIKVAARHLGVDERTWGRWEEGRPIREQQHLDRVAKLFGPFR
jgi:transcriptional regulator with XRE-family HTH domain